MGDEIQDKLASSLENKYLLQMFELQRSMVYYQSSINSNQALIDKLKLNAAKFGFTTEEVELLDDISIDSVSVLDEICEIWDVQEYDAQIIAASIRNPIHIVEAAKCGAHIATVPYKVLLQSLNHPLTDKGLESFLADYDKMQTERQKFVVV